MPLAMADLPPFNPPYVLAGSVLIVVGRFAVSRGAARSDTATPVGHLAGISPGFGVLILSDYRIPPSALPLKYHELIAAKLVRRGLWLRSKPLDMILDAELPVELGHEHYGLPKRFDESLRVHMNDQSGRCEGQSLLLAWRTWGYVRQCLSVPLRLAVTLGIRLFTHGVEVEGSGANAKRARIALTPSRLGELASIQEATIAGQRFRPWLALYLPQVATELGAPHPLS